MTIKQKSKHLSRSFQMKMIYPRSFGLGTLQYNISSPPTPDISGIIQKYFQIKNDDKELFSALNVKCDVYLEKNLTNGVDIITNYTPILPQNCGMCSIFVDSLKVLFPIPSSQQPTGVNIDPSNPPPDKLIYYGPNSSLPNNIPLLDSYKVLPNQFVFYFYNSGDQEHRLAYFNLPSPSGIIQNTTVIKTNPVNKQVSSTDTLNVTCIVYLEKNLTNGVDIITNYTPIPPQNCGMCSILVDFSLKVLFPIPSSQQPTGVNIDPSNPPSDKLIYYGPNSSLPNNIPLLDSYIVLKNQFVFYFYNSGKEEYRLAYFNLLN